MKKSDLVEVINIHEKMLPNAYRKAVDSKAVSDCCGDAYVCLCSSLVRTTKQ